MDSPTLIVDSGQILLFRLFDVAEGAELVTVERILRSAGTSGEQAEGVGRLRLQRQRDGVVFTNPPVSARLDARTLRLGGVDYNVKVFAKVYDFGVLTILWALTISPGTSFDALSELSVEPTRLER
jgi:hypothetical protein